MSAQVADPEMPYEPYSRSPAIPQVVAHAIKTGQLDEDNDPVAFFIDLERIRSKVPRRLPSFAPLSCIAEMPF